MFEGFAPETIDFLRDVKARNSKAWFEKNRPIYQKYVLQPFQELVMDMSEAVLTIDPDFDTRPFINRTISRIFRDTRFSKDKSLFRDRVWLTFKPYSKEWKEAPAYFFEITPVFYRYGMGYYSASRAGMDRFRGKIDATPADFLKAVAFYDSDSPFRLEGKSYKRPLKSEHPPRIQDWYQRRNFYLTCENPIDDALFSPQLEEEILAGFFTLAPLYQYLKSLGT